MANYVFVHGGNMSTETWNRLTVGIPVHTDDGKMGAKYWDGTVSVLRAHGHQVIAPTLPDETTSHLADHIDLVCRQIAKHDLRDVILVGHSFGGMVITGVADAVPRLIRRLVYVDAALPDPGQSLYDILQEGLAPSPSARPLVPEPAAPYTEKLQFNPEVIRKIPKTYILCTKSEFGMVTRVAREKIAADKQGWTLVELPASHVPMADLPGPFYRLMLGMADQ